MARKNSKPSRAAGRRARAPATLRAPASAPPAAPPGLDLEQVRIRIDAVDEQIHGLISERARLAQQVGISKSSDGRTVDFYRPEREAQVLRRALERIERVCSHPQSLGQCRQWLEEHLAGVEQVPVSSNAEGARRARDEKGSAAIAGETAAEVYGLKILAAEIEDRADNTTRFLVLGRKLFTPSGEDRTTLLVSVSHTDAPGALYRLLEPLARHRVSLTRIESRPSRRRKWDYVFFMDLEGHADQPHVAKALAALKKRASLFRVLGSYPRAVQ